MKKEKEKERKKQKDKKYKCSTNDKRMMKRGA